MKTRFVLAALTAMAAFGFAAPASASQLCYDLQANVNGSPVVAEADCVDLP